MLPLRAQIAITLFIGLLLGILLSQRSPAVALPLPATPTPASPEPFVTLGNVLMVSALVRREGAPEITAITPLDIGRLTVTTPGDSLLDVQDTEGISLYRLSFQPRFLGGGEPPRQLDEVTLIFVVPLEPGAARIVLTTPGGTTAAEVSP